MSVQVLRGKKVSVHGDGEIFVDGKKTNFKQWKSSLTRYSNLAGQEQSDLSGKTLEEALYLRGFLGK
jgi:predicted transcriptional regulator